MQILLIFLQFFNSNCRQFVVCWFDSKITERKRQMRNDTFQNPVLTGFYPDPSIVRVNEDYYLAASSFAYFPGLPIFHSRDLVHWEQSGYGISRPQQLDYQNCETSLGLWAPTIRYHEGLFYIVNTFVSQGREARRDNFIITAKNPSGPWSDARFIEGADGIDPSLFFDRDGRMWYTGNYISSPQSYEGHHGIYLCELDRETFQIKGERKIIWDGAKTGSRWLEAPHLYYENGYYYLIAAEGGTFKHHSVVMARCRTIDGDYEFYPGNPVLTHRHLSPEHEISVTGHADLVQTQHGEWWMVLLGVRPYRDGHFNLGRETFLVPVRWDADGWLHADNDDGLVHARERLPDLAYFHTAPAFSSDNFDSASLSLLWNSIHPCPEHYFSLTARPGFLRLCLQPQVLHEICTPAFLGRRQQHSSFQMQAAMEFTPACEAEEAGIALVQDDRFHYTATVSMEDGQPVIRAACVKNSVRTTLARQPLHRAGRLYLTVSADKAGYHFYYGYEPQQMTALVTGADPVLLSSVTNAGFTGTYLGMYASSNGQASENHADFDWFLYEGSTG